MKWFVEDKKLYINNQHISYLPILASVRGVTPVIEFEDLLICMLEPIGLESTNVWALDFEGQIKWEIAPHYIRGMRQPFIMKVSSGRLIAQDRDSFDHYVDSKNGTLTPKGPAF